MSQGSRVPVITLLLIAANIVAAFVLHFQPNLANTLGFLPGRFSAITLVTSCFLHSNVVHLLGNMTFLAAVGPPLEFSLRPARFAGLYLLGGVIGNLTHWAILGSRAPNDLVIGASGAIAACVAVAGIRYFHYRVPLTPKFSAPIFSLIFIWIVLQALAGFVKLGQAPGGVSHWAHLGGIATGLVLAILFRMPKAGQLEFGHEVLDRINTIGPHAQLVVAKKHLEAHPNDPKALITVATAYKNMGQTEEERVAWLKVFEAAEPETRAMSIARLDDLHSLALVSSRTRSRVAEELRDVQPESSRILLQSVAEGDTNDPERPEAILALALLLRESAPSESESWTQTLEREYPLHATTQIARNRGLLS